MTSASVTPTGTRRGAHSEAGRPMSVRAIGVAINRPAKSPIQHVAHVKATLPGAKAPEALNTAVATLAAMTLLARHEATKRATSPGSVSTSGWRTKRRTSAAPTPACSAAPRPMITGETKATALPWPCVATRMALTQKEPSATAPSIRQP